MPATGKRKANRTSFKKGMVPHNKSKTLTRICPECGERFSFQEADLKYTKHKYCSKKCCLSYRTKNSKYKNLLALKKTGLSTQTLAKIYHVSSITINSTLNRLGHRAPLGKSYCAIRNRILKQKKKECCICGYNRYVELAHIVRAADGGALSIGNTVILCPNHHRLFDANQLLPIEQLKLEKEIKCLPQYQKVNIA